MNGNNQDIKLMKNIRKGSPESDIAFYELYHKYSAKLNAFCLFKARRKEIAEEIFQETWIRFYKSVSQGNQIEKVLPYLITIARNLIFDNNKDSKNTAYVEEENFDIERFASPVLINEGIENDELFGILMTAVNGLDNIYKEAFIMKKIDCLSYQEISEICGESTDCIKKRVLRATMAVKKTLQPYINEL